MKDWVEVHATFPCGCKWAMSNMLNPDEPLPYDWIIDAAKKLQWLYHDRLKKHICPTKDMS